jgi:hypothetical protein
MCGAVQYSVIQNIPYNIFHEIYHNYETMTLVFMWKIITQIDFYIDIYI